MKYAFVASGAALVASVMATGEAPSYTTKVVTAVTTYCPEATQITHGGNTYTVTEVRSLVFRPLVFRCTLDCN